jgi:hypothetical protein
MAASWIARNRCVPCLSISGPSTNTLQKFSANRCLRNGSTGDSAPTLHLDEKPPTVQGVVKLTRRRLLVHVTCWHLSMSELAEICQVRME